MNDTPEEIEHRLRALFMQRTGSDRVRMACEMFDCARGLMVADIKATSPDISPTELRVQIFERTYRGDFDGDAHARIVARLRG